MLLLIVEPPIESLSNIIKLKLLNVNKASPCRGEPLRDDKHDDGNDD